MFSLSELVSKYKPELPPSLPRWYPPQRPPPLPSHLLPFVSPRLQEPVARETMPLISRPLELQSIRIGVRVPSLFAKFLFHRFFCVFLTDLILNSLLPPEPPASDLINARCVCMHFVMCYGDKNGDSNCLLLFIHFYLFFYRYFLCSGCGGRQVKMGTVSNQYCSSCGSYINEQAPSVRSLIGLG